MGKVVVELYWKHAPKTCQNFASLAARGYYNNTKFHRIIPGFMVQGGDPTATGKGGDSIYGQVASPRSAAHIRSNHTEDRGRKYRGSLPFRGAGTRAPLSLQHHLTLNPQPLSVKAMGVTEI
jgi:cyclophilin family peptidyl-prolyl cis-trans isomerase